MKTSHTILLCIVCTILGTYAGYRATAPGTIPEHTTPSAVRHPPVPAESPQARAPSATESPAQNTVALDKDKREQPQRLPAAILEGLPEYERQKVQSMLDGMGGAYTVETLAQYEWLLNQGFPSVEQIIDAHGKSLEQLFELSKTAPHRSMEQRQMACLRFMRAMSELSLISDLQSRRKEFESKAGGSYMQIFAIGTPPMKGYAMLQVEKVAPGAWPNLAEVGRALLSYSGDLRVFKSKELQDQPFRQDVLSAIVDFSSAVDFPGASRPQAFPK